MPSTRAVTGSSAPRRAVSVLPMHCMALAVKMSDMTVGKSPNPAQHIHMKGVVGSVSGVSNARRTM